MPEFALTVNQRETGVHSKITKIRQAARVPGIVYGFAQEPVSIDADYNELLHILKKAGTSHVVTLNIGGKEFKTIIRSFQQDPVTDKITHVDFWLLKDDREITTRVPLEFLGVSKAVKEKGGKLNIKNDVVNVRCLPKDLPATFQINLETLAEIGQTILIKDIDAGDGVNILNNPNDPVISITLPKKIKITAEETAEAEAAAAEAEAAEETAEAEAGSEAAEAKAGEAKANETEAK